MFRIGCLFLVLLLIGIPAVSARYMPWWGTVLVVLGEGLLLLFLGPKLAGFAIRRFALGVFMTKSKVLRDATVSVHRVEPTERPARRAADDDDDDGNEGEDDEDDTEPDEEESEPDDEDDDADDKPVHYVLVDFTLTPKPGLSVMQFYDPSELMLAPFDHKVTFEEDPTDDDAGLASVERLWLVNESGAETEDFDKITGPAHLRVVFECPQTLTGRAKFRYYFETFGEMTLPPTGGPIPLSAG
jgi:hypothetical protein